MSSFLDGFSSNAQDPAGRNPTASSSPPDDTSSASAKTTFYSLLKTILRPLCVQLPGNLEFDFINTGSTFTLVFLLIVLFILAFAWVYRAIICPLVFGQAGAAVMYDPSSPFFVSFVVVLLVNVCTWLVALLLCTGFLEPLSLIYCRSRSIFPQLDTPEIFAASHGESLPETEYRCWTRICLHPFTLQFLYFIVVMFTMTFLFIVQDDASDLIGLMFFVAVVPFFHLYLVPGVVVLTCSVSFIVNVYVTEPRLFNDNPLIVSGWYSPQILLYVTFAGLLLLFLASVHRSFSRVVFGFLFLGEWEEDVLRLDHKRNDLILSNLLPDSFRVLMNVKGNGEEGGRENLYRVVETAGLLFVALDGFDQLAKECSAMKIVTFLNRAFLKIDRIVDRFAQYRIKSVKEKILIGVDLLSSDDVNDEDTTLLTTFRLAVALLSEIHLPSPAQSSLVGGSEKRRVELRIGLTVGSVVVGMIGSLDLPQSVDVLGDSVNTSSRLCDCSPTSSVAMRIDDFSQLPRSVFLEDFRVQKTSRELKGKGQVEVACVHVPHRQLTRVNSTVVDSELEAPETSTTLLEQILSIKRPNLEAGMEIFQQEDAQFQEDEEEGILTTLLPLEEGMTIQSREYLLSARNLLNDLQVQVFPCLRITNSKVEHLFHDIVGRVRAPLNIFIVVLMVVVVLFIPFEFFAKASGACSSSSWSELALLRFLPGLAAVVAGVFPMVTPCYLKSRWYREISTAVVIILATAAISISTAFYPNCLLPQFSDHNSIPFIANAEVMFGRYRLLMAATTFLEISFPIHVLLFVLILASWIGVVAGNSLWALLMNDYSTWAAFLLCVVSAMGTEISEKHICIAILRHMVNRRLMTIERERSVQWLECFLPAQILRKVFDKRRLAKRGPFYAKFYENVAIFYGDIVQFTRYSAGVSPAKLVERLNCLLMRMNALASSHDVVRVQFIGDCGHFISSLKSEDEKELEERNHVLRMLDFATDILETVNHLNSDEDDENTTPLQMRIGIHLAEEIIGAVVGVQRFQFSVFGTQDSFAEILEATSKPMKIHVSAELRDAAVMALNRTANAEDVEVEEEGEGVDARLDAVSGRSYEFLSVSELVTHPKLSVPIQTFMFRRFQELNS